jgi:hypothetical protein
MKERGGKKWERNYCEEEEKETAEFVVHQVVRYGNRERGMGVRGGENKFAFAFTSCLF